MHPGFSMDFLTSIVAVKGTSPCTVSVRHVLLDVLKKFAMFPIDGPVGRCLAVCFLYSLYPED